MKQMLQKKERLNSKSSVKEKTSSRPKYEDKVWQAPKYGLKNTPSADNCCGCA